MPPVDRVGMDRQESDLDEDEEEDRHVLEPLKPIVQEASIMKSDTHHQLADFQVYQSKCNSSSLSRNSWQAKTNMSSGCFVESNLFAQSAVSSALSSSKSSFLVNNVKLEGISRHAEHNSAS